MSYKQQVSFYKMAGKSHSAVSSDRDLQVIRGSQLSSSTSDYLVQDLIGKGTFAKVAKCVKSATNEMVAVRIMKKHSEAEEEDGILQKLTAFDPDRCNFVRWNTSFIYKSHLCQEFELLDMSLKEFVDMRQTSSLQLKEIRPILHQVATTLQVLKSLGIAHTDLKPENIMLVDHVRQPLKVKLIDFGSTCDPSKAERGSYIQPRWYRAPEAILGLPCTEAIDMWSLGCIAAELFLGYALYPGSCEYEMIWYITQTQGQLPGYFLSTGLKTRQFYRKTWPNMWKLMTPHEYAGIPWIDCMFSSLDDLKKIQQKQDCHLSEADAMADKADLENFVDLVKQMLQLEPTQRITPSQVLQLPFITMSNLKDFCCPQSLRSNQGESTQQPQENQESTTFSCVAQSPQILLSLLEDKKSSMAHIKPREKRKRAYAEILQTRNRSPGSTSPSRKKRKIHTGRSVVKRSYGEISKGCKKISEIPLTGSTSPARKTRKIHTGRSLVKRPYDEVSKGKITSENPTPERKRRRMTIDTEEKDTALPSTSKEAPSSVNQMGMTTDTKEKDTELPSTSKEAPSPSFTVLQMIKAIRSQVDKRASGSKSREKKRKEDKVETKIVTMIWIIGSSYIRRGEEAAYEKFGENFGLNARVEWFGKGGMRWNGVLPRFYTELSTKSPPDILVIHAGGNDLGLMSAKELASVMRKELMQLHAEFPAMTIAYSCINERQAWRYGRPGKINKERKTVNTCMRKAVGNFGGEVIEHPLLRYFDENIYLADGVHFTKEGNEIFVTSIQHALKKILQKSSSRKHT